MQDDTARASLHYEDPNDQLPGETYVSISIPDATNQNAADRAQLLPCRCGTFAPDAAYVLAVHEIVQIFSATAKSYILNIQMRTFCKGSKANGFKSSANIIIIIVIFIKHHSLQL